MAHTVKVTVDLEFPEGTMGGSAVDIRTRMRALLSGSGVKVSDLRNVQKLSAPSILKI